MTMENQSQQVLFCRSCAAIMPVGEAMHCCEDRDVVIISRKYAYQRQAEFFCREHLEQGDEL